MILSVTIQSKSIGNKELFNDLTFNVETSARVAIIGRNGVGKTTLFNMLSGKDEEYTGAIQTKRGLRIVSTAQEHHAVGDETPVHYILRNLPEYDELKHIIDTYPDTMGDDIRKIEKYSDALERFGTLNYYDIENEVAQSLQDYQISNEMAYGPLARLSGGQKRFVELVRIEHSHAELALIDEPTNHMDYIAKAAFIEWLKAVKQTVLVITHDRDVLKYVDRVIEIKDGKAITFKGNYEAYLKQNATSTATKMHDYEIGLKTLDNLNKQIQSVRAKKASTSKTPNPFIPLERRLMKEHAELSERLEKPNFWIDRESAESLGKKVGDNYDKYKAKNIRIGKSQSGSHAHELLRLEDLQLGYGASALFEPINISLQHGERLQLVGRNGVGKTTLVRAVMAASLGQKPDTLVNGAIVCNNKLQLSVYDQEINPALMQLTLSEAVAQIYYDLRIPTSEEAVMRVMGDYLFDPHADGRLKIEQLSGGQKARLQIIKMLANNPNLLILDEPTNHLDLPSIEELENSLMKYHGALVYVSHDSYFAQNLGGDQLVLQKAV
ncbi:MAG TPA: ATP-binding cassette domain-containing protein [Candidatus Saccharimonadales bacterium]|nr:ATP-binding cassette domain-containing protein [Candidatus Saccharimonadales bacterium]